VKEFFTLSLAKKNDQIEIMSFIKKNWLDTHILANNTKFFNYQYFYKKNFQFILAKDTKKRLKGILGFIQYNPDYAEQDIFLALWKVLPNQKDPILGIKLIKYLRENVPHKYIHCVGINKKILEIYKFLGYQTGQLDHYVAFNQNCSKFIISRPPQNLKKINFKFKYEFKVKNNPRNLMAKLKSCKFYKKKIPFKPLEFLYHRYHDHPYFNYIFLEITEKQTNIFKGLIILRKVIYKNSTALRIIDIISDDENIPLIINDTAGIINNTNYEYIDVYVSGINNKKFLNNNFENIIKDNNIIVPDHFDPFEKKNNDILYASSNTTKNIFFKGDGDQDQPRLAETIKGIKNE